MFYHQTIMDRRLFRLILAGVMAITADRAIAHPGHEHEDDALPRRVAQGDQQPAPSESPPEISLAFEVFVKAKAIQTRWDNRYFYVESRGIPDHPMMIGITAWQQQVPLPQNYAGDNAWQIPLRPVSAKNPRSTKNEFLRGAIAIAANGIPIFNPLNNRGEDANLAGELDEYGGHCGRADDYHYHLAPVHLQTTIGKGLPIAYALDGYPIYGYEEPDGSKVVGLDKFNGHKDANGNYHYHASKTYPYLNGGFYGEITQREGQVEPQPRAEPLRPALSPLRDAKITDFQELKPGSYRLTYTINKKPGTVTYTTAADGSVRFEFLDINRTRTNETYYPKRRPAATNAGRKFPSTRDDQNAARKAEPRAENKPGDQPKLIVTSTSVDRQGRLAKECTCDGVGLSPAIEWKQAPPGTKYFAVSLWHTAPDQEKSYWLVYNIPSHVQKLDRSSQNVGMVGINDRRKAAYEPMCSKGPGVKTYHLTVYALSAEVRLPEKQASRAKLLTAIKDTILAEGTLDVEYERK
ncbi:YHYH protein [Schlesneria paludicola]|uniref:YHYH protein n=1 Tax=Schlesneria paludicola TaxID=360056 RepID=UPI00029B2AE3|nr:YHYH protein [Schlesneria paludicola]